MDASRQGEVTRVKKVHPLLKWAGGKRQLLPQLRCFYPSTFTRYLEPFLGGGAVFCDLYNRGQLTGRLAVLMDANTDLIGCYQMIRDTPRWVADILDDLMEGHLAFPSREKVDYYDVRERFNATRQERRSRAPHDAISYTPELAAMFIYLNRTGFNGLFRLNRSGDFNVPMGRYEDPIRTMKQRVSILRMGQVLENPHVHLARNSFDSLFELAEAGDFIYLDPPYAPLTATANFTAYTAAQFSQADQQRLQQLVIALAHRGCHVLLSNSTAAEIAALYEHNADARAAGLRTFKVSARRSMNRKSQGRGPVQEYLVTNITNPS